MNAKQNNENAFFKCTECTELLTHVVSPAVGQALSHIRQHVYAAWQPRIQDGAPPHTDNITRPNQTVLGSISKKG